MSYNPATSVPKPTDLTTFQWSTPSSPNPRLAAPISKTATTLTFTAPPLDYNGAVITTAFLMGVRDSVYGGVEHIYVPAGGMSADGLTATGVTRGIYLQGLDFTTGNASLTIAHGQDSAVFCDVSGVIQALNFAGLNAQVGANIKFNGRPLFTGSGIASVPVYADATARNAAILTPSNGDMCYLTAEGYFTDYVDNAWVERSVGTATPNASETVAGKIELATNAEMGLGTSTGGTGARLVPPNSQLVQTRQVYTPAYLTGGTNAQSNYLVWQPVNNASFRITIDGTARNIDGINFAAASSMSSVASIIQTAIRAVTSGLETVTWSTNKFIISSGNTTSTSAITVTTTSTGTVGTDISGAGASNWLDSDTGNGTVTNKVINLAGDANKIVTLDSTGKFPSTFVTVPYVESNYTFGEAIDGTSTPVAVYLKSSDGKVYKSAASATESTFKFIGFVNTNVANGAVGYVITSGLVTGFTGLTADSEYFLADAAGTISTTSGTNVYKVARSSSTTAIVIEKGPRKVAGLMTAYSTTGSGNSDATVTCGFPPTIIKLYYELTANSAADAQYGIAIYSRTTLIMRQAARGNAVTSWTTGLTANSFVDSSAPTASNSGSSISISINSVSDTGFVVRRAATTSVGTQVANVAWEVEG